MSKYPQEFDDNSSLFLVKDALKVTLGSDYKPGDSVIVADGDVSAFPPNGIITLVDQCSIPEERSVSFYYGKRSGNIFSDIELAPYSIDCAKPKKLTTITMQVMAEHREALKDAILAIESFLGTKHTIEKKPNGKTIFGRINFLMNVLMSPKAWFVADKVTGVSPLTVKFTFSGTGNTGPVGDVSYKWKFGDEEITTKDPMVEKTFLNPGNYTVGLLVENHYGQDEVTFVDMVTVKGKAPEEAFFKFLPQGNQLHFANNDFAKIRARVNQLINIEIPQQIRENKKTFAGELLDELNKPIDTITKYTWNLGDELPHGNSYKTKALYNIGGLYDITLKTETKSGSFRISKYENCIDIVEPVNLWIWSRNENNISCQEFSLIGEVLKSSTGIYNANIDSSFLDGLERAKFEFMSNNGAAHGSTKSGDGGNTLIYWASGRKPEEQAYNEKVEIVEYNGFADIYNTKNSIQRPWNWASLAGKEDVYFILGNGNWKPNPTVSMTNQTVDIYSIKNNYFSSHPLEYKYYKNGANDLMQNPGIFDSRYNAPEGHFSAYRTTWKENTGYLLRNSGLGEYFSFNDFYRTDGTVGSPFQGLVKLPSMPGNNKEGSLVSLNGGIYFFGNFGQTYCFNDLTMVWETVNPHSRLAKKELDKVLAASDAGSRAYVQIEGIEFFKFNETDMTYTSFYQKPNNGSWLMTIY